MTNQNDGGSPRRDAGPKPVLCAAIDDFRRTLCRWTPEGYRLEFSHRHNKAGECRGHIEVSKETSSGEG